MGASLAQGHAQFSSRGVIFFQWDLNLMMGVGLGKPQLHAKFEVAGFIYYGNIRTFVFKRQIPLLHYPLGSYG